MSRFRSARTLLRATSELSTDESGAIVESSRKTTFFPSGLAVPLDDFLQHQRDLGKRYESTCYGLRVLDRVLGRHGVERPDQVSPGLVEEFLRENQPSVRTRNKRLLQLKLLYRYLCRRGLAQENPAERWPAQPEAPFVPHIFSLREIGRVLQEARRRRDSSRRPFRWRGVESILYLLYACGMRLSEPLKLRLCDVDLSRRLLFIAKTKFYKQRWVPFGPGTAGRLKNYLRWRERVFPLHARPEEPFFLNTRGGAFSKQGIQGIFRSFRESLGLQGRGTGLPRLHDFRHSLARATPVDRAPACALNGSNALDWRRYGFIRLSEDLLRHAIGFVAGLIVPSGDTVTYRQKRRLGSDA
ncbi:MAG: tyrosine-type recombinase/integrase [Armatimonadetes bacterium]|nr:tyrosine-type recombinase/integrase [Armatimonadota bacterium]